MSEVTEESSDIQTPDERTILMQRARLMGIKISNNIGLETLKAKIAAHTEPPPEAEEKPEAPPEMKANALPKKTTHQAIRERLLADSMRLVRLRITNLDPKKKDLPGEIFTVANKFIGTVRKFVPFGEVTENGYHVPYCIYEMMKERKFLNIRTRKVKGVEQVETNWVPEFALEVLPPLTEKELKRLALQQAAAAGNLE